MKQVIKEHAMEICQWMEDKKAMDILAIDVADRTIIADYFVIASGRSDQQVRSICDQVEEEMQRNGQLELLRKEGYQDGRWIVLDYGDILVHIFHRDERKYYNLERLWMDDSNVTRFGENENLTL